MAGDVRFLVVAPLQSPSGCNLPATGLPSGDHPLGGPCDIRIGPPSSPLTHSSDEDRMSGGTNVV